MFKSAEKLRHEAAQRQLDRVASTWRGSRTTWFDGTPESIEARLAQTERVLTVARSGYTPAHLELTVEAENARRELMAAKHRLLTDFLDDGARAFQGSKRVAAVDPVDPESDEYTSDTGWKMFDLPGDSFNDKHDWLMKQLGRSPQEAQEARDAHYKSNIHEAYGQHSFEDRIDEAYDNRGRLDEPLVGVNPGDGIYRNHPGMIDGYDEGDYATSPGDSAFGANSWDNAYDASEDPNFVPADYLGPAGRDLGGKHRRDAGLHTAITLDDAKGMLDYENDDEIQSDPDWGGPARNRTPDAECKHCGQPVLSGPRGEYFDHVNNDGGWVDSDHEAEPTDEYYGPEEQLCHHGLSAWLCADPINHYPRDM